MIKIINCPIPGHTGYQNIISAIVGEVTYQDAAGGSLAGDELPGPVLGLCHERALELLLALAGELLLLLLGVVGAKVGLLAAAQEGEGAPYQHDQQPGEESADAGQEEAPVLADVVTGRVERCDVRRALFGLETSLHQNDEAY